MPEERIVIIFVFAVFEIDSIVTVPEAEVAPVRRAKTISTGPPRLIEEILVRKGNK